MRLYHYTSKFHFDLIKRDKVLKTTDAVLRKESRFVTETITRPDGTSASTRKLAGQSNGDPEVVWLTTIDTRRQGWMYGSTVDKGAIRIAVNVRDPQRWPEWSRAHGIDPKWYRALAKAGGKRGDAKHWYVVERPISQSEWVEILDIENNKILWTAEK